MNEDEKKNLEPWEDEEEDDEEVLDAAYAGLQGFMYEVDGLLAGESGAVRYRELLTEGELWEFVDLQEKARPHGGAGGPPCLPIPAYEGPLPGGRGAGERPGSQSFFERRGLGRPLPGRGGVEEVSEELPSWDALAGRTRLEETFLERRGGSAAMRLGAD